MDLKTLKQRKSQAFRKSRKRNSSFSLAHFYTLAKKNVSFSAGLNNRLKERFFSEMGMLLSAGVDLQHVLELAQQGSVGNKRFHDVYQKILYEVTKGNNLADAMISTSRFNNFDCYSVMIGESTGELSTVFQKLQIYYSKKISQKRKIISALSYPIIVLMTTAGAITFMLKFVVPMFADTLLRFGGELPALTKFIISCSNHIGSFIFFSILFTVLVGAFYYQNRHKPAVKKFVSDLLLRLPILGRMFHKIYLAQFTQAMDLLLSAKVNIVESIALTQKMIRFYPLSEALLAIQTDVLDGSYFYKSLEKQNFFDQSMITLVKIGEEVNQLDKIFAQLSKQYESELEYQSNILLTILEPLMILLLAVIVGVILIAMYLPMFKLGTVIR